MIFLYSFLQWFGGTIWISFSSISATAADYYSTSEEVINFFSLVFLIMQLPMAPLSSLFLRKSYYWTMMAAYIISVLGVWIKVIAQHNVILALFGQFLIGSMNSMTLAACSTLTAIWFKPEEQTLAVAIASTSNLLGAGCGLILAPFVTDIRTLLLIHAGYTSLAGLLNVIFSRKQTPLDTSVPIGNFRKELSLIFKDWYLLALIFFISSGMGIAYGLSGVIYQVLFPFGITEAETGWIGFSMYMGAITGGLFTSLLVYRSKSLIGPVRVFAVISLAGMIIWAALAGSFYGSIVGGIISGFGLLGFKPLGIQAAVYQNKNIEESIPTNLIFLTEQILSVAYTYPFIYFYGWTQRSGLLLGAILTALSFCVLLILYTHKFIEKYRKPLITLQKPVKEELEPHEDENFNYRHK